MFLISLLFLCILTVCKDNTCSSTFECTVSCLDECKTLKIKVSGLERKKDIVNTKLDSMKTDLDELKRDYNNFVKEDATRKTELDSLKTKVDIIRNDVDTVVNVVGCVNTSLCDRIPKLIKVHRSFPNETKICDVWFEVPNLPGFLSINSYSSFNTKGHTLLLYVVGSSSSTSVKLMDDVKFSGDLINSWNCKYKSEIHPSFGTTFFNCSTSVKTNVEDLKVTFVDMDI